MTRLSSSLLLEAKTNVKPLIVVSTASDDPDMPLWLCLIMNENAKSKSSSLLRQGMKDGRGDEAEDSGSYQILVFVRAGKWCSNYVTCT